MERLYRYLPIAVYMVVLLAAQPANAAVPPSAESTTITATIGTVRIIVVDRDGIIQQIVSNTPITTPPRVTLETPDGVAGAYTAAIQLQYRALQRTVSFTHYGVVYDRASLPQFGASLRSWDVFDRSLLER